MFMKKIKIHFICITFLSLIIPKILFAQVQQGHTNQNKFRQLYVEFADPNNYRNASGAPGVEYYQQKVDYKMDIELDEEVADGTYSNLAIITHSHSEFIIDFIRMMPGVPKAKVKSRVILTPSHAKRLLMALKDNTLNLSDDYGTYKYSIDRVNEILNN